jgi:hypothetical protein
MDLGVRQIRSAGKGSGSIELTLPSELRDLVGLQCRVVLRDGGRPDIVLQPDFGCGQKAFSAFWQKMAAALLPDDIDAPPMPMGAFGFGLQPRAPGGVLPFLSWCDGLALAAPPPHDRGVVARTVSAFAQAIAGWLDIDPSMAAGFGSACGHLVCGVPAAPDVQEACDLVAAALQDRAVADETALAPGGASEACAAGVLSPAFWRHATPLLVATADLFRGWTRDPAGHATLRAAWRRGRAIEMGGD